MDSILSTLYNSETLDVLIKSNPIKFAPLFARSLQSIVESLLCCMHELLKEPCLAKVLLKTLRAGYLLSEHLKVINKNSFSANFESSVEYLISQNSSGFEQSLAKLGHLMFRLMHSFNY